jgi:hypothetical protein
MNTAQEQRERRIYVMAAGTLMVCLIAFGLLNSFGVFR